MLSRLSIATILCLAIIVAAAGHAAADDRLPTKKRVILLFKVLTFDKQLTKGRDALRVGVVARAGDGPSEREGRATLKQLNKIKHMRVQKLSIEPTLARVGDGATLSRTVADNKLNLLYLAPGVEPLMGAICKLARDKRLLVLSGETRHARRCAALTVVARDNRPKIIINKGAASRQGAAFKSAVLRKAQVID